MADRIAVRARPRPRDLAGDRPRSRRAPAHELADRLGIYTPGGAGARHGHAGRGAAGHEPHQRPEPRVSARRGANRSRGRQRLRSGVTLKDRGISLVT